MRERMHTHTDALSFLPPACPAGRRVDVDENNREEVGKEQWRNRGMYSGSRNNLNTADRLADSMYLNISNVIHIKILRFVFLYFIFFSLFSSLAFSALLILSFLSFFFFFFLPKLRVMLLRSRFHDSLLRLCEGMSSTIHEPHH